jgi:outer membrane protein OmpA-like peptidoglycan-associated protein
MFVSKRIATAVAATALLSTTAACIADPVTGEQRVSRAAIGAALGTGAGFLLGDLIGGRNDRTEKIVGAGIGAIAGGAIGAYIDRQEQELRRRTAGTGIVVERQGNELLLHLPAAVSFQVNRYDILPQFRPTLDQVAQTLAEFESTYVDVYGHTDPSGGDAINVPLSQNRAQSVANYLSQRGVNPARIMAQGFGSSRPLPGNMNATAEERAANRRVEIRIVPIEQRDLQQVR